MRHDLQEAGINVNVQKEDQLVLVKSGKLQLASKDKICATLRKSFEVEEAGKKNQ